MRLALLGAKVNRSSITGGKGMYSHKPTGCLAVSGSKIKAILGMKEKATHPTAVVATTRNTDRVMVCGGYLAKTLLTFDEEYEKYCRKEKNAKAHKRRRPGRETIRGLGCR